MLVNDAHLLPDLNGVLVWPKERLIALADLHLDKPALVSGRTARARQAEAPFDIRYTLDRLAGVLRLFRPRSVVCLDDSLFGPQGQTLEAKEARDLSKLVGAQRWIWVTGRADAVPPPCGGEAVEELPLGSLVFRRKPKPDAAPGEVSAFLHPKASTNLAGQVLTRPCFVTDGARLILPAFGAYGGGVNVLDPSFKPLFRRSFHVFMLGDSKIRALPRARLEAERP
ncbi:phosphoesterase [Telmatospirillum sp. J64-1]|uniref:phosphoesterase n=1 Tax=Telmatospirillum sp. J64-1 TaxID=2502183 RepID=UPI00115DB2D1|nr:phosphoesterase [Telmatospirillum sp. J64-1]